jgi:hypothetical protein
MSDPEMTPEQKKCDEDTGHDFDWVAPEYDVGFCGYGQCKDCGWVVAYEEPDLESDYGP